MIRRNTWSLRARAGWPGHVPFPRSVVVLAAVMFVAASVLPVAPVGVPISGAQASPGAVTIVVRDAVTGVPITNFKWLINLDNSHDEASLENPQSFSPVVATGDQTNAGGIDLPNTIAPDRGYLVSVYANDGVGTLNDPEYKIGGKHFKMPADAGDVIVELQPNPLPLATIKARVFVDNASINGEWDNVTEGAPPDVEGFHIVLDDIVGEVTTDWFGNPICTEYEDINGSGVFDEGDIGPDGPTPIAGTGGFCHPGPDGIATIPNLGPDKYAVEAVPPDGSDWVQTSTIEGTLENDAWIQEGADGFATEPEAGLFTQVWFGFVRPCTFGDATDSCPTNNTKGTGLIKGTLRTNKLDTTETVFKLGNPIPDGYVGLTDVGAHDAQVYMARANPDGTFEIPDVPASTYILTIWDQKLDHIIKFLRFTLQDGGTVDIGGLIGSEQGRGVPPWFANMVGSVYIDANENGIRDPGEAPIKTVDLDSRFKDGTIWQTAFTDNNGRYEFPEVGEIEHFFISEVGYGRFKQTGAAVYNTDEFDDPVDYPWADDCRNLDENGNGYADDVIPGCTPGAPGRAGPTGTADCTPDDDWKLCEHGPINQDFGLASLLQATFLSSGQSYYFDWGKNPFGPGENGGIVGIAFNATTRNELNAQLQANEDYEPGIPGVTVNLYAAQVDGSGNPLVDPVTGEVLKDHVAATYVTDSFYDLRPTDCIPIGTFGRDPTQVQPYPDIWNKCLEVESILNQDKPGVFDGGYAFDLDCTNDPDSIDPAQLIPYGDPGCVPVAAGKWVVQVVPPTGFRSVMEEDINVFSGDTFVPAVPPPPCAGPLHTVDLVDNPANANFDPANPGTTQGVYNPDFLVTPVSASPTGFGSPYQGLRMPLCNERLIDLKTGFNANSDFFMFTDARYVGSNGGRATAGGIPVPGRIIGILLDDLALDLDPTSAGYAGKRGIPDAPIGIRDFSGKLITTVYSDDLGRFEVLLPSTGTYNCPLPAGPCPGMYFVVGNDAGDPNDPDPKFNPNYQTLPLVFEVWPGLTTYADVAIIPNTNFVAPGPHPPVVEFDVAPACITPDTTPDVRSVSQPYGTDGTGIAIRGSGFGGSGVLTLGGVTVPTTSWGNTTITFNVPGAGLVAPGPQQLLVANGGNGATGTSGITFHVLGAGYNPPLVDVLPGATPADAYANLQNALDTAADGDLILVHPNTDGSPAIYFGHFIMHANVKLQGYGPGVTILDGRFVFNANPDQATYDAKVLALKGDFWAPSGQTLAAALSDVPDSVLASGEAISVAQVSGVAGLDIGQVIRIDSEQMLIVGAVDPTHIEVERALNGSAAAAHSVGAVIEIGHGWDGATGARIEAPYPIHFPGVRIEGVPWGQVLTVLARDGQYHSGFNAQIDGFKIEFGRNERGNGSSPNQGGGIYVHGYARYLVMSNNLIQSNFGSRGGGVILGLPSDYHGILDAQNDSIRIHHNQVLNNGGKVHAGALAIFNGAQDYEVDHNLICGNYAAEYGGGVSHFGMSPGGRIHDNRILFNYAFDEGGGVMVAGELHGQPGQPGTGLSLGSGPVTVARNLIQGNVSNDDGGGIRLLNPVQWKVRIVNNLIVDNLATDLGGGISMDDALDVEIVNNTVAKNISTATAEDADISCNPAESNATCPHAAGLSSEPHSAAVIAFQGTSACTASGANCTDGFSNPKALFNNIFWHNEAFYNDGSVDLLGTTGLPSAGFIDLEVVDIQGVVPGAHFDARSSDCSATSAPNCDHPSNQSVDPQFLQEVDVDFGAFAFANDPSFVYVVIFASPSDPPGDYHIAGASPVVDDGVTSLGGVFAPTDDYDGDIRGCPDQGADEAGGALSCGAPPAPVELFFSTAGDTAVPGVAAPHDNADIYSWNGTTFDRIFDASVAGLAGNADIDALVVEDSNTFYMSFSRNAGTTVPTLGAIQDEDVVKYDGGTWSLYFDGSDVGLADSANEDVDAFEILTGGEVVISTTGNPDVTGITGEADEDLLRCAGSFGSATTCTWTFYLDGADAGVGLGAGGEDTNGAAVDATNIYLTTTGDFSVAGPLTGHGVDVFTCNSPTTGPVSSCASFSMFFDGSGSGLADTDVLDAIDRP